MTRKFATIFSGGGLADIGMIAAGWEPIWAVEHDAAIAGVYRQNIDSCVMVADVRAVNYAALEKPDHLHASPSCKRASVANSGAVETAEDIETGEAVCRAIRALLPETFTLENVYAYRRFEAYRRICATLTECGYWWEQQHVNAADTGVPQTRKRLFVRATQGDYLRPLPSPVAWNGWHAAIEDLIPTLPESKFADWQLRRMGPEILDMFLSYRDNGLFESEWSGRSASPPTSFIVPAGANDSARAAGVDNKFALPIRGANDPIFTVKGTNPTRAFLVSDQSGCGGEECGLRTTDEPASSVRALSGGGNVPKAFLLHGTSTLEFRNGDEPSAAVMATVHAKAAVPKAFLMAVNGEHSDHRGQAEPAPTVSANHAAEKHRAFLVDAEARTESDLTCRNASEPSHTIKGTSLRRQSTEPRAWLSQGRVVAMTPRCLARFQSVPDSYILPDNKKLACVVIGNGVPCLTMQRIAESLTP